MMINKRLIGAVPGSMGYIAANVGVQLISLGANIGMMTTIARLLHRLSEGTADGLVYGRTLTAVALAVVIRYVCAILSSRFSYHSSKAVKRLLRRQIYEKLLRLGSSYSEQVQTSQIVQVAVEGVEQLETYFGQYLPQFFYAMLAPLTLFGVLSFVDLPSAAVLLMCVPLIPVTIAGVQRWAKKLLGKYWGQYTALGDTFLENLQGLTTTKIYQSDGFQQEKMNEQSERFRVITMKVLTMQLNSITIMDLIAYGGAALGVIIGVLRFRSGHVDLTGCLMILLLAADFFLPMRLLGSFFHIAMNGMAASDKIFHLLDLPEPEQGTESVPEDSTIRISGLSFAYEANRPILHDIAMEIPAGSFTALVGESGCGKSTIAAILMGRSRGYSGTVQVGGQDLRRISEEGLMEHITYISHQSHLFRGTVRENLRMASPDADDQTLWQMLERVKLADFLRSEEGLDTLILEDASNFSGGQRQRLALARGLLHDSPVYIFDEATSNIDVESENDIMREIHALAKTKTVILISHRLANVQDADRIYVLDQGRILQRGDHRSLLNTDGHYAKLWNAQQELEQYTKGENR